MVVVGGRWRMRRNDSPLNGACNQIGGRGGRGWRGGGRWRAARFWVNKFGAQLYQWRVSACLPCLPSALPSCEAPMQGDGARVRQTPGGLARRRTQHGDDTRVQARFNFHKYFGPILTLKKQTNNFHSSIVHFLLSQLPLNSWFFFFGGVGVNMNIRGNFQRFKDT